jgi:predicted metal-dependent hydrolase
MFSVRIEQTAGALGYDTRVISGSSLGGNGAGALAETEFRPQPGEMLHGAGGELFRLLTEWQPALLIFDLGNSNIPWQSWIGALKSSPATRRLPILCYGPHVEEQLLADAQRIGADQVVPRSRFASAMPRLIQELALQPDKASVEFACSEALLPTAEAGIAAFNRGEYFEAHEELEAAWMEDQGPGRELYRSILQVAVAYYQVERGNYRGAVKMLLRVRQWLAPLPDICRGVDIARLREDVALVQAALIELGPQRVHEVDRSLFRPVRRV